MYKKKLTEIDYEANEKWTDKTVEKGIEDPLKQDDFEVGVFMTNVMDILEEKKWSSDHIAKLASVIMGIAQKRDQNLGFNNITYEKIIANQAHEIKYFIIEILRRNRTLAENIEIISGLKDSVEKLTEQLSEKDEQLKEIKEIKEMLQKNESLVLERLADTFKMLTTTKDIIDDIYISFKSEDGESIDEVDAEPQSKDNKKTGHKEVLNSTEKLEAIHKTAKYTSEIADGARAEIRKVKRMLDDEINRSFYNSKVIINFLENSVKHLSSQQDSKIAELGNRLYEAIVMNGSKPTRYEINPYWKEGSIYEKPSKILSYDQLKRAMIIADLKKRKNVKIRWREDTFPIDLDRETREKSDDILRHGTEEEKAEYMMRLKQDRKHRAGLAEANFRAAHQAELIVTEEDTTIPTQHLMYKNRENINDLINPEDVKDLLDADEEIDNEEIEHFIKKHS